MGYKDEFCTTVKSTDSLLYFPENTSTDFYVKLPHTIVLDGDWSVGVNQIWMDKMWYNVTDTELMFANNDGEDIVDSPSHKVKISDGYYDNIGVLAESLNTASTVNGERLCTFTYNEVSGKMTTDVKTGFTLIMVKHLSTMLGSHDHHIFSGKTVSAGCVDLHLSDRFMHVHTNIVGGYFFPNSEPTILKTLSTDGCGFGGMIYNSLLSDHTRVFLKNVDVIRVMITNRNGVIKQLGGQTVIQFHFRREWSMF